MRKDHKPQKMNINFDWYKHNAIYYDQFDADSIPYEAISSALERVFVVHKIKTIIDLGCGTGNFYIPLAKKGFEIVGVDNSFDMIKIARNKVIRNNLLPNFIEADIRLPITGIFDAAVCLYNVIGDLNYVGFAKVIKNMVNLVPLGGLISFDVINYDNVKNFDFDNKYFAEKEVESAYHEKLVRSTRQRLNRIDHILEIGQHATKDGVFDQNSQSKCKMHLYTWKQVHNLLEKYKLRILILYGGYDESFGFIPFKPDSPMIGVIAKKMN